jgi:hypothetical protein
MHSIICPEQIGFSKDSRTSDHMFVLKTLIDKYTQQGSKHLYTIIPFAHTTGNLPVLKILLNNLQSGSII